MEASAADARMSSPIDRRWKSTLDRDRHVGSRSLPVGLGGADLDDLPAMIDQSHEPAGSTEDQRIEALAVELRGINIDAEGWELKPTAVTFAVHSPLRSQGVVRVATLDQVHEPTQRVQV